MPDRITKPLKPSKRDKLVLLQQFANIETGTLYTDKLKYEDSLYDKSLVFRSLARQIVKCKRCSGLNIKRFTEGHPGWGNLNADIFFIGQSLHEPGMLSGLPFIKGSGYSIAVALRLSGLKWNDVFFSNVIHCHPEKNRESTEEEKDACLPYLASELEIVRPKLIVALGNDAKQAIELIEPALLKWGHKRKILKIKHPASFMYGSSEQRIDFIVKLSLEIDKILRR